MKKILFLFTICLLVAGSVSAQGNYSRHRRVRHPQQRSRNDDFYKVKVGDNWRVKHRQYSKCL